MIHRHYRRPRVPHPLAALAALVLLITAWTDRDSESPEAAPRAPERFTLGAADSGDTDPVSERRPRARFSLMLFRFN